MDSVGKLFTGGIVLIISLVLSGLGKMMLWNWFIAPLGLPEISFLIAIGISLTIVAFRGSNNSKIKDDTFEGVCETMLASVVFVWFIVLIGAVVRLFV